MNGLCGSRRAMYSMNVGARFDPIRDRRYEALRATAFRHSYATARLYTAEHGAPVSLWIYGHTITQRTSTWRDKKDTLPEVVEFRIEDHQDALEERLLALR